MDRQGQEGNEHFDERPQFARTPGRDIFGKLDGSLPEIRIPYDVEEDARRAAASGVTRRCSPIWRPHDHAHPRLN